MIKFCALLLVLTCACVEHRWTHDVVVAPDFTGAPSWSDVALRRVVEEYDRVLAPFGVRVRMASPGEAGCIAVEWSELREEYEGYLGYTDFSWGLDGSLSSATIRMRPEGWAGDACAAGHDLETALLHEMGHAVGLPHSGERASVMFPDVPGCPVLRRALGEIDTAVLRDLYR